MYMLPLILFSIIAILIVIVPYFRNRTDEGLSAPDVGVYKAQLTELKSELDRGLINEDEAKRSRIEIERRILKAADQQLVQVEQEKPSNLIAIMMLALMLFSTVIYAMLGTPSMPDYPKQSAEEMMAGSEQAQEYQKTNDLKTELLTQLEKYPPDARGLAYLSRLEMNLGNFQAASAALYQAHKLAPDNFEIQVMYAESLIVTAGERVTPAALVILNKAAVLEPDHAAPKYYLALADFQAGDVEIAHQEWVMINNELEASNPLKPLVSYWIGQAEKELGMASNLPQMRAPAITSEQAETIQSMGADERQEFIFQMVQQLAEKQQQNPSNIEGWLRLSQAYKTLGQNDEAIKAMQSAVENAPDDQKAVLQKEVEKLTNLR